MAVESPGYGIENEMADLGSRSAIVSTNETVVAIWTDTRAGNEVSIKQDLARAVVRPEDPTLTPGSASSFQPAAVVVTLIGLIMAVTAALAGLGEPNRS